MFTTGPARGPSRFRKARNGGRIRYTGRATTRTVMPSFDIVSKTDVHEVDNALDGVRREIGQRFDFKGSHCSIERKESENTILDDEDPKLKQNGRAACRERVR